MVEIKKQIQEWGSWRTKASCCLIKKWKRNWLWYISKGL